MMMVPPQCYKSPPMMNNHTHHMKIAYVRINIWSIKSPTMILLLNNERTLVIITDEMITKFQLWYEEGYDLNDPLYQKWLDANNLGSSTSSSILANYEDVSALNTVAVVDMETTTPSTPSAANNTYS